MQVEERHQVSWRDRTYRATEEKKVGLEKRTRSFATFDEWFQHFWLLYDSVPSSFFYSTPKPSNEQVYQQLRQQMTVAPFRESVLLVTIGYMCLYNPSIESSFPATLSEHVKKVLKYWVQQGASQVETPFFYLQIPRYVHMLLKKTFVCS